MAVFPYRSLREWIEFLEEQGQLVRIKDEVDILGDVSAIAKKATLTRGPGVLMENIKGYPGWRILTNTLDSKKKVSWALGVDEKKFLEEVSPRMEAHTPPMEVDTGPCKEVKFFEDDVDLARLPIPFVGEFEGTPSITAGISNKRDVETAWQNIAVRRFGLKGKDILSEFINPTQQDYVIWQKYRRYGEKMPVAIIIGVDPIVYLMSQTKAPAGFCEYDLWGNFTGVPLEVVKCETCNLYVPASAEVIIEGEIDPHEREYDGPFPEHVGYYTSIFAVARVKVKCITMRKDPIYYFLGMGEAPTEGHRMTEFIATGSIYRAIAREYPGVLDMRLHAWGYLFIKVDKKISKAWPSYAVQLGSMAKFYCAPWLKGVIVVDNDCEDLEDYYQIFNALHFKTQPSKDFTIIPRTVATVLDPSEPWAGQWGWQDFLIIDATEPPPPWDEGYKRGRALPPRNSMKKAEENWGKWGFKK